jgi:hypothetical protein
MLIQAGFFIYSNYVIVVKAYTSWISIYSNYVIV